MKKKTVWKILLIAGILPFVLPFLLGLYRMSIESWSMIDWLVMYSFIYWPTYAAGLVLIIIAANKLLSTDEQKDKKDENNSNSDR